MKQPRLTLFGVMVLLQNNKASIQVKHQTAPELALHKIRQSKINSRWVAGPIGQTNRRPSV